MSMKNNLGISFTQTLSVLGIIAILASAGAYFLVDSITQSQNTACYISRQSIIRAEQLYLITYGHHTKEYLSLDYINEQCSLVNNGFLHVSSNELCIYRWVEENNCTKLICENCNNVNDDQNIEQLLLKRDYDFNNYDINRLKEEYQYIADYLVKNNINDSLLNFMTHNIPLAPKQHK